MKLVLAGTNQEYHDFAASVNYRCKQITGMSDLRGLHGIPLILVGSYASRQDWEDINSYLDFARLQISRK